MPFAQADPLGASSFYPLYNGNIAAISSSPVITINGNMVKPLLYAYKYDQLNRLVQMRTFKNSGTFSDSYKEPASILSKLFLCEASNNCASI